MLQKEMSAGQIAQKAEMLISLVMYHLQKMQQTGLIRVTKTAKSSKGHTVKYYGPTKLVVIIFPKKEGLILPPQILFDGEDHPPYVKRTEDDKEFSKRCENLIECDYDDPKSIKRSDIEEKFRTGKGHGKPPGSLVAKVRDPHDKAQECYKKYLGESV